MSKRNEIEIFEWTSVERGSGYYLVDRFGVVAGPFERLTEAQMWLNKYLLSPESWLNK